MIILLANDLEALLRIICMVASTRTWGLASILNSRKVGLECQIISLFLGFAIPFPLDPRARTKTKSCSALATIIVVEFLM